MTDFAYGGVSFSHSFACFCYGADPNLSHLLELNEEMECVFSPASFAPAGTEAATWHRVRFKRVMGKAPRQDGKKIRWEECKMWEVVWTRPLTEEEIVHHQALLGDWKPRKVMDNV